MNAIDRAKLEDEIELQDRLVLASEGWGKSFLKDQTTHAETIKLEARIMRAIRRLFSDIGDKVDSYVSWGAYEQEVERQKKITADSTDNIQVDIIVNDSIYDDTDQEFIKIIFNPIATTIAIGAQAGESIYGRKLGITSFDDAVQKLATDRVAWLVGKKVDKDGKIIDNPSAKYNITDKMRDDINRTIKTGINLGQDRSVVAKNLQAVIANPKRAEVIAQTETVNAYGQGHILFGRQSGATGKKVDDVNAVDECRNYASQGFVPLDYLYGGLYLCPAFHVGCRCGQTLAYANEYNPNS